jgi:hypothetical protein
MPLPARLMLVAAVAALGALMLYTATGGLARAVAAVADSVGGFVDNLSATPTPSRPPETIADAPVIETPQEPYTNQPTVDLVVLVPASVIGKADARVRLYLSYPDKAPAKVAEATIGITPRVIIPGVKLAVGGNAFTATVTGPAGESDPSPVVTFILDTSKPKVTLTSPKNGATVNQPTVTLAGKTQGRSAILVRNDTAGVSSPGTAAADGTFSVTVALASGVNAITIEATDPAGNAGQLAISLRRGTGKLAAKLSASAYTFSRANLPDPLTLTVLVSDPDGAPLPGASVTFSLTIPGVGPVTQDRVSDATGHAVFQTTVPRGASVGTGVAAVYVTAAGIGTASAKTVITIAK